MWFKNLNLFRVFDLDISADQMAEHLSEHKYAPCPKHKESSSGWISPFGGSSEDIAPASQGCILFCLKVETRKVPANTINEELEKQIDDLKREDPEAKITTKLKKQLKEEIKEELLPYAFSKYEKIFAYWDTRLNYLVVDVSSRTKAETFVSAWKLAMPQISFSALPVQTQHEPTQNMTEWLRSQTNPSKIEPLSTVSIRDIQDDKCSIKYNKQDLDDARLIGYLGDDKTVSDLEVEFDEKLEFVLTEDFMIKSLKWGEELKESAENEGDDSAEAYLLSSFETSHNFVKEMVVYLIDECFGGEKIGEDDSEDHENHEDVGEE